MRAVAGAEPAAEVACTVTDRHTAQMCADADHHQPFACLVEGAVLVRGVERHVVAVLRVTIGQIGKGHGAGGLDLGLGAAADEHRFAQPFHRQLRAGFYAGDIDADRGERLNVGGRVHLVDKRPHGRPGRNDTGASCGVVEEIPPGAFVIFCVGHEVYSIISVPLTGLIRGSGRSGPAAFLRGYLAGLGRGVQCAMFQDVIRARICRACRAGDTGISKGKTRLN